MKEDEDAAGDEKEAAQQACACKGCGWGERNKLGSVRKRPCGGWVGCVRAEAAVTTSCLACAIYPTMPRCLRHRAMQRRHVEERGGQRRSKACVVDVRCVSVLVLLYECTSGGMDSVFVDSGYTKPCLSKKTIRATECMLPMCLLISL